LLLGDVMAKKKSVSLGDRIGQAVSDMANAASVAATGSEIGVLELAAEGELRPSSVKRARVRKPKVASKKTKALKKSRKPMEKKRTMRRR
jgi:hypothetical protein